MSEALSRRQFLAAGISLAGTALFAQQDKQDTLIPALKEYITAQQDVTLKKATEIPARLRANLESALAENGLEAAVLSLLEKEEPVPALTKHFESRQLAFRQLEYENLKGYELVRVTPQETRKISIVGSECEIPFRDLVEDVIPHPVNNTGKAKGRRALLGGTLFGAKVVELRPQNIKDRARFFYEDHLANEATVAEQLGKKEYLDKFVELSPFSNPDAQPKLKPEFWKAIEEQLRYKDMRERYDLKTGRDAVIGQLEKDIVTYVSVHEAIHYRDVVSNDWSFLKDLDNAVLKELKGITAPHSEARAYLGAAASGYARPVLAHVAHKLSDDSDKKNPNYAGGEILFKALARAVATNGKKYGVDVTPRTTNFDVFKLLPALEEKHLQEAAVVAILGQYHGKSLRDYIKDFVPEKR